MALAIHLNCQNSEWASHSSKAPGSLSYSWSSRAKGTSIFGDSELYR